MKVRHHIEDIVVDGTTITILKRILKRVRVWVGLIWFSIWSLAMATGCFYKTSLNADFYMF
jgi:hypothetical protein